MSEETQHLVKALRRIREKPLDSTDDLAVRRGEFVSVLNRIYGPGSPQEQQVNRIKYYRRVGSGSISMGGAVSGFAVSENFAECKKRLHGLIDGAVEELESLGLPTKPSPASSGLSVSVNQTVNLNVVIEAVKDELTGQQLKELREALSEPGTPEQKRSRVLEKAKSFGSDVASNILAGIITNPQILGSI
ncbi:hypothetical protein [Rubrivirga sp. SAORIC476]|uniref:hypothetical protein n=1 Tax=Rubrivirga sp. SAORIC476 TaxID=1961794 RepID=UPI00117ABDBF|nr:hypothetical protein [Rubrivirga sp. SAORIC476]